MFHAKCSYEGQRSKDGKRMHGRGIFSFADGNKYVGMFHDGAFHGPGIVFFTEENGGGQYRGVWDQGENISGQYFFSDGLPYDEEAWGHCTEADRRLYNEFLVFVQPCGVNTTAEGAKLSASGAALRTIVPDYTTSDGVPAAFAEGKPRSIADVTDAFWRNAAAPKPEHEETAAVRDVPVADMAVVIAESCPRPQKAG